MKESETSMATGQKKIINEFGEKIEPFQFYEINSFVAHCTMHDSISRIIFLPLLDCTSMS